MDIDIFAAILDTIPSPIVFVDTDHTIRYLNKASRSRYYEKRGYPDLLGKSLLDCHQPPSREQIKTLYRQLVEGADELFLKVSADRETITVVGVRDGGGQLIGYYERFEKIAE